MTNFEKLKNFDKDELVSFLNNFSSDETPWNMWFNKTYCNKCDGIEGFWGDGYPCTFAYCEKNDHCRYFPNISVDEVLTPEFTLKAWLDVEATDD